MPEAASKFWLLLLRFLKDSSRAKVSFRTERSPVSKTACTGDTNSQTLALESGGAEWGAVKWAGGGMAPSKVSRRNFLKRSLYAGGGTILGCVAINEVSPRLLPEELAFDPSQSYWAMERLHVNPPLTHDFEADVAIIGGGYTGLSTAYHMAGLRAGRTIVVLEGKTTGSGASGRNGGMLLPQTANEYMQVDSEPEMHRRVYQLTVENMQRVKAVMDLHASDCELELRGNAYALTSAEKVDEARRYAELARPLGISVEFWDSKKTQTELGTGVYQGALFDPSGGQLHPMKWARALKAAAEGSGVIVFENTPVIAVEEGELNRLHTAGGATIKARSVVLATNAFTSKLGYFRNALAPVHSYIASTGPLPAETIARMGWRSRVPYSDSKTLLHYLALNGEDRVRIGGGYVDYTFNNGMRKRADEQTAHQGLHAELLRRYPALEEIPFDFTWSGVVDMTLDNKPFVGVTGKHGNIYYGLGYCGHGVNMSFLFGRIIADLEAGRGETWKGLPFLNHRAPYVPNEPFRWMGIESEVAYYRITGR